MSVLYYGVRHLSPAGAYHLCQTLDEINPDLVLIEGASDLNDMLPFLCHSDIKLPIAFLCYTKTYPIQTIRYPLAEYSPEYQGVLWAYRNGKKCKFIDLPSDCAIALETKETEDVQELSGEKQKGFYHTIEKNTGESFNDFWERGFEQIDIGYENAVYELGKGLRLVDEMSKENMEYDQLREAYMRFQIEEAKKEGYQSIVCICGAYHVEGLKSGTPMTKAEIKKLPRIETNTTLMPYSYYRLSQQSGYGAGNNAPAYFEMIWQGLKERNYEKVGHHYISNVAQKQREQGHLVSVAEVLETVQLSKVLANLRGSKYPILRDLKDAIITCMGGGMLSHVVHSMTHIDIGTRIGAVPKGVRQTSIQIDFYHQLNELKLERFYNMETQRLELDLRENLRVKSEKSAFLDLNRSFFLHQLRVLNIPFCTLFSKKEQAVWKEIWELQWSEICEIELVESTLLGDTIADATLFYLKEKSKEIESIFELSLLFQDSFLCGIDDAMEHILERLNIVVVEQFEVKEISETMQTLSSIIRYGSLRKFDYEKISSLLSVLYLRVCFCLEEACQCNQQVEDEIINSMETINRCQKDNSFLEEKRWISLLKRIAMSTFLNPKCSGFALALLMERKELEEEVLATQMSYRFSPANKADVGARWFEGLALENHHSLISRIWIWQELNTYLDTLDDQEFKRAVVFLRRAFSDFSIAEKHRITENLAEIWGVNSSSISGELLENVNDLLEGLDDFDFSDI